MDTDGVKSGFDLEITKEISKIVNIPVIASGGAGNMSHFKDAFEAGAAAGSAAGGVPGALVGGALGVASSLLGGLFGKHNTNKTNDMNYKIMQEQNRFNSEEAKKNRDWQELMYRMYGTSSAKANDMRAAGLNALWVMFLRLEMLEVVLLLVLPNLLR